MNCGLKFIHVPGDAATGRVIPEISFFVTQGQHGHNPAVGPAGFDAPRTPSDVGIGGPMFPSSIIESGGTSLLQVWEYPDSESGRGMINSSSLLAAARSSWGSPVAAAASVRETSARIGRVQQIANRFAVNLDQRGFVGSVGFIGFWRTKDEALACRCPIPRGSRRRNPGRPADHPRFASARRDGRRVVLHAHQPRQRQQHPEPVPAACHWSNAIDGDRSASGFQCHCGCGSRSGLKPVRA